MSDEVIAELRREIDALRARVFELEGAQRAKAQPLANVTPGEEARVSRRNLLGKAGAVAAAGVVGAAVGGGVLAQPAAADNGQSVLIGRVNTGSTETWILMSDLAFDQCGFGVADLGGTSPAPAFISAYSRKRPAGAGPNIPAFRGDAESSYAFYGTSRNVPALFGTSTGSAGVQGNCTGDGPAGVIGASTNTAGVWGLGQKAPGVLGQSTTGNGVFGTSTQSYGVRGESGTAAGVYALSQAAALEGHGGTYGAWLQGARAAVRLVPQTTAGAPTSGTHLQGELMCDNAGALWFCTAKGAPGTWKKIRFV
jgi:hypothetical protein